MRRAVIVFCCCIALAACGNSNDIPSAQESTTASTTLPDLPSTTASKPKRPCSAAEIRKIDADIRRWEQRLEAAKRDPDGDTQLPYEALDNLYQMAGYCNGIDIDQDPNPGLDSGFPDGYEPEPPPDQEPDYP